jgi:hypothetical protein
MSLYINNWVFFSFSSPFRLRFKLFQHHNYIFLSVHYFYTFCQIIIAHINLADPWVSIAPHKYVYCNTTKSNLGLKNSYNLTLKYNYYLLNFIKYLVQKNTFTYAVWLKVNLLERLSFGEFTCIQNNLSFQMKEKNGKITLPDLSVSIVDLMILKYR